MIAGKRDVEQLRLSCRFAFLYKGWPAHKAGLVTRIIRKRGVAL